MIKLATKIGVSILNYLVEREELNNQVDEMVTVSLHLPTEVSMTWWKEGSKCKVIKEIAEFFALWR